MSGSILVIDNFYENPHPFHMGFHKEECLITDETVGKISQIVGNPVEVLSASNEKTSYPSVVAHLASDWIAIINTSFPLQSFGEFGVSFYSHLETGLETFPSQQDMAKYQINDSNIAEKFNTNRQLWKQYGQIPAKYNRLVLFRSNLWHSYTPKEEINTSIFYQKLILKNV